MTDDALAPLIACLGHSFRRPELLHEALTHPSVNSVAWSEGQRTYDRLEFLGDRVLGLLMAERLWRDHPEADSGHLARRYNQLVRREALADVAQQINLGRFVRLAASERATGGAEKPAILADACEALFGALYIDGGLPAAEAFFEKYWVPQADRMQTAPKDAKTQLQETAHKVGKAPPEYVVVATEGPPHEPVFTIEVRLEGLMPEEGQGTSKRKAEQAAAAAMLLRLPVL